MKNIGKLLLAAVAAAILAPAARAAEPPSITGVAATPDAQNGKVVITFAADGDWAGLPDWNRPFLSITATDNETGSNYVASAEALAGDTDASPGPHAVTWDYGSQGITLDSASVTFTVAYLNMPDYCVIDLSGADATSASLPVSYLDAPPAGGFNNDAYKTTNLVMRLVAPGTFTMGGSCSTTLTNAYYIAVFETTQRQWELVTGGKPSYFNNAGHYATRPVEQVSYDMIRGTGAGAGWPVSGSVDDDSFIGVLRLKTGLSAFDLPTEAQWEYACRAGTETDFNCGTNMTNSSQDPSMDVVGRYWYNGGQNYSKNCDPDAGTATVGSYAPNAWGLYDMHGNVFEWCLDWYADLAADATEPVGPEAGQYGDYRVLRGGSVDYDADYCRSAYRGFDQPDVDVIDFGFRLARTLSKNIKSERSPEAVAGAERAGTVCAGAHTVPVQLLVPFATRDIELTGYEGTYDGAGHTIGISTNAIPGLSLRYWSEPASSGNSGTLPLFTNVCEAVVWVEASAPNYFTATNSATVKITPRAVTLTSGSAEKAYDGTPVTCADVLVGGDGFASGEGATYGVTGSQTHAGASENTFTYTLNDGTLAANYAITTSNGTLTVTKATNAWATEPTITGWTYGDDAGEPDLGGATFGTATVTYSATPTDAGDYTATFIIEGTDDYDGLTNTVQFTISRATITMTTEPYEGTYDGAGHTIGISTNAIPGLSLRYWSEPASSGNSGTLPLFTNVCEAVVYVEASAPNYFTATNSATVKITPRAVTLTSGSASKTYDGTPVQCADVLVGGDGFASGEGATYGVTGSQTHAGASENTFTYTLNDGTLAANYAITTSNGTLKVTKATNAWATDPTITGWKYGKDASEPVLGEVAFGEVTVTYRDEDGNDLGTTPPSEPGRYEAVFTVADTDNYEGLEKTVAFSISQRRLWYTDAAFGPERAATFNGYLVDPGSGCAVAGTIRVKAGKPSKKTGASKLTVTVKLTGQKKITLRGSTADGTFRAVSGGRTLDLLIGACSLSGAFGEYEIDGSRDLFAAKDLELKAMAAQALAKWQGTYAVAWQDGGAGGWNALSFTVKAKGKVKVTGALANGTRVASAANLVVGPVGGADTRLLVGEKECAVAVNWTKKGVSVSCILWFCEDGTVVCEGLPGGGEAPVSRVTAAPVLEAGAEFRIDTDAVAAQLSGVQTEALPDGVAVRAKGRSFETAKPGKVKLRKDKGGLDLTKAGENPAGLKLKYAPATGLYKGFFTAYTVSGGKLKKRRVRVAGVLLEGAGYGTACLKGVGTWETGIAAP